MRKLLTGLTVLAAVVFAGTSYAANGTVDMSWDNCTPIVQDKSTTTPGIYSWFISELGNDSNHQGHETRVIYGNQTQTVPDAWRFDATGCETSAFVTLDHTAPAAVSKTCPSFSQAAATVPVKDLAFSDPVNDPYAATTMRIVIASGYGAPVTANPAVRYFLGSATFNLTSAVVGAGDGVTTCGGLEQSICFKLTLATYYDATLLQEISFDRAVAPGAPLFLTWNGPTACPAVPVRPSTWGAIKGQYRN